MILGIIFLIASQAVLIPIVFNVHKTNNKVLSLFGYIHISEIKDLALRCEKYTEMYLEDEEEKKNDNENKDISIFNIINYNYREKYLFNNFSKDLLLFIQRVRWRASRNLRINEVKFFVIRWIIALRG